MSITFSIESEQVSYLSCNVCGGSQTNPIENFCENDIPEADAPCFGMGFRFAGKCLNVSETNAFHLMRALNLDCESTGEISGEDLLSRLSTLNPEEHTRPIEVGFKLTESGVGPERLIHSGISESQMSRYIVVLTEIANKAISQNKLVVWS